MGCALINNVGLAVLPFFINKKEYFKNLQYSDYNCWCMSTDTDLYTTSHKGKFCNSSGNLVHTALTSSLRTVFLLTLDRDLRVLILDTKGNLPGAVQSLRPQDPPTVRRSNILLWKVLKKKRRQCFSLSHVGSPWWRCISCWKCWVFTLVSCWSKTIIYQE